MSDVHVATDSLDRRPLSSVRICDLSGQLAGAGATRMLAALGAEVIRVEDPSNNGSWDLLRVAGPFPDGEAGTNRSAAFNNHNVGKLGVTMNLRTGEGKELLRELIAASDVVTENFAAGVFERLGFSFEELQSIKADVIYVSHNGFGSTGPYAHFKSWGPIVQAYAGLTSLSKLPEMEPAGWGYSYMDHLGAWYMAIAILAALHHKQRTGQGQAIDLAGTEAGANLLGPYFLDYTVNDRSLTKEPTWSSNRSISPSMSPHGIFPTSLDDRWVSLAVRSDAEWRRLASVIDEAWSDDERFSTLEGRLHDNAQLEAQIGAWSVRKEPEEITRVLRAERVAVAVVASPEERIDLDEATSAFGLWPVAVHSELGPLRVEGLPFHLSEGDWEISRGAPCLGEHNDLVIGGLLGHSPAEIEHWREAGVL